MNSHIAILAFAIACIVSFASSSDYETKSTDIDMMKNIKVFEEDILDKSEDPDAIQPTKRKWSNKIVPYVIDSKLKKYKPLIKSAMELVENRTLLKFVKRKNEHQYIRFIRGKSYNSHIGRKCSAHPLSLDSKCSKFNIIVHELMRAIRLVHKHHKSILPDRTGDEVMQNPDLFEGDMLGFEFDRHAVTGKNRLWPSGLIPYTIDPKLKAQEPLIREAMQHYADKTCIRFIPRTDERNYVRIFSGRGCFSHVGNTLSVQSLSLGPRCLKFGVLLHELGHTVGFFHEHSRVDRDEYLDIHYDNIQEGMETQFMKFPPHQNKLLSPFDFDSVMLYGGTVFSKNLYNGLETMTAKNGRKLLDVTQKTELSDDDIERINKLYHC